MKKRRKYPLGKKIKYLLEGIISKGILAQILLLAGTSFILTLIFGAIAMRFGQDDFVESYWTSLMHMIDQGTITADEAGTDNYFMFMLGVTFVGMAFTSTIIAIISSGIQGKLGELNKGHTDVVESEHVVILGFDENACTICSELAEGSILSGERICLVVADDLPREEMEHAAREYQSGKLKAEEKTADKKMLGRKARLMFRSGDPVSENTLKMCSVLDAKAVVINRDDDIETIRVLLGLVRYLKKNNAYIDSDSMPSIVAAIHDTDNRSTAIAAAEIDLTECDPVRRKNQSKIRIMNDYKMLESLFAHTCVQQGTASVMDGLFDYQGTSICIEPVDEEEEYDRAFVGKTLHEISEMVVGATPLGFVGYDCNKPVTVLNPDESIRYKAGDRLIYLSESRTIKTGVKKHAEAVGIPAQGTEYDSRCVRKFLFIGWNYELSGMLSSIRNTCLEGSAVNVITEYSSKMDELEGNGYALRTVSCDEPYNWGKVKQLLDANPFWFDRSDSRYLTNIVPLSPDGFGKAGADEKVMALLINIRNYLKQKGITDISITSEMRLPQNQALLQNSISNDYIVTTDITNRMIAQITDDPRKHRIMEDLIEQKKYIVELNPVSSYMDVSQQFNFEGVFQVIEKHGRQIGKSMIPMGWLQLSWEGDASTLMLNPSAEERGKLYPGGNYDSFRVIVLKDGYNS